MISDYSAKVAARTFCAEIVSALETGLCGRSPRPPAYFLTDGPSTVSVEVGPGNGAAVRVSAIASPTPPASIHSKSLVRPMWVFPGNPRTLILAISVDGSPLPSPPPPFPGLRWTDISLEYGNFQNADVPMPNVTPRPNQAWIFIDKTNSSHIIMINKKKITALGTWLLLNSDGSNTPSNPWP